MAAQADQRAGAGVGVELLPIAGAGRAIGFVRGKVHLHAFIEPVTVQMVNAQKAGPIPWNPMR